MDTRQDGNKPGNNRKKSKNSVEKKKLIIRAATEVFASKGFHSCRISDIATRAGVAYGLVYHYFENKEEILATIFDKNWGLLNRLLEDLAARDVALRQKMTELASLILDAYRLVPALIHVMVIEIARSSRQLSRPRLEQYERSLEQLSNILASHQRQGEVRAGLDCRLLAYQFFGSLELVLTGYLLHMLPSDERDYDAIKKQLVDVFMRGIS